VSDVGSRWKCVKVQERRARRLHQPRPVRTEGAPPLEHPGPRGAKYWSQKEGVPPLEHPGPRGAEYWSQKEGESP